MNDVVFKEIIGRIKERIKFNNQIKEKSENEKLKRTMLSLLVMCIVIFSSFSFCISNTRISNNGVINEDSSKSIIDEFLIGNREEINYLCVMKSLITNGNMKKEFSNNDISNCIYYNLENSNNFYEIKFKETTSENSFCLFVNEQLYNLLKVQKELTETNMENNYKNFLLLYNDRDFSNYKDVLKYRYELCDYGSELTKTSDGYYPIAAFDVMSIEVLESINGNRENIKKDKLINFSKIISNNVVMQNDNLLINKHYVINGDILNCGDGEYLTISDWNYGIITKNIFEVKLYNNEKVLVDKYNEITSSHEDCYNENINYIKAEIIGEEGEITDYLSFEVFYKKLKNA